MERIIKFRAWDKGQKKMTNVVNVYSENDGTSWWSADHIDPENDATICSFDKDSGVLMQYTGLKDENGKEIYESDILKTTAIFASDKIGNEYFNVVVKWSKCRWVANGSLNSYQCRISEIIGNIYENKNLI